MHQAALLAALLAGGLRLFKPQVQPTCQSFSQADKGGFRDLRRVVLRATAPSLDAFSCSDHVQTCQIAIRQHNPPRPSFPGNAYRSVAGLVAPSQVLGCLWSLGMKVPLSFGAGGGSSAAGRSRAPQLNVLESMLSGDPLADLPQPGASRPGFGKRGRAQQLCHTRGGGKWVRAQERDSQRTENSKVKSFWIAQGITCVLRALRLWMLERSVKQHSDCETHCLRTSWCPRPHHHQGARLEETEAELAGNGRDFRSKELLKQAALQPA